MQQYKLEYNLKEINNRMYFFIIIVFISVLTSCKKFVEVDPPITQLVTATVFTNNTTATAALTSIYSKMFNDNLPYNIALYTGLSGDELTNYSTFQSLVPFYTNSLDAANGLVPNIWSSAYKYIYQANAIIEGLQNSNSVSASVKQQLTGEAKFIRAFWHFYLVDLFGDIPLVMTTDYIANAVAQRSPKAQVYQQIVADLKDAQNLLNNSYVGADGITTTTERVRPNKWVATAFLARVYLYASDWLNAESQATALINNIATYKLKTTLDSVFLKNSTEAIWQLMIPLPSSYNTYEGRYFILIGAPLTNTNNCTTLSSQLLNSFEIGDNRKIKWVKSVTSVGNIYYYPYKYKVASGSPVTEYSMVLRLAEQYFIRAEARVQQNNLIGAQSDLNTIRHRAGLSDTTAATQSALLDAIIQERKVELFTEWGHRWLDLKRTNRVDVVMNIVTPQKGGTWNTNWQLYPIPQTERTNDPNLTQNSGY